MELFWRLGFGLCFGSRRVEPPVTFRCRLAGRSCHAHGLRTRHHQGPPPRGSAPIVWLGFRSNDLGVIQGGPHLKFERNPPGTDRGRASTLVILLTPGGTPIMGTDACARSVLGSLRRGGGCRGRCWPTKGSGASVGRPWPKSNGSVCTMNARSGTAGAEFDAGVLGPRAGLWRRCV